MTLVLALIAATTAACSFVPKLKLTAFLGGKKAGPHRKNLLFFGDIAALTMKEFEAEIAAQYCPVDGSLRNEYIHDLVVQVNVNSSITRRKMRFFTVGVASMIAAVLSLLIPTLYVSVLRIFGAA